jgi:RNA polymerase sigma-70 factor, ECF subfamily
MTPGASQPHAQRGESTEEREFMELMVRYQRADASAVEELVNRLSPRLLRFLAWPRLNPHEAEDLLQDCWMRIHRGRHTYRPSQPVLPWIFAIARHTRLDGYRKRRRLESREKLVAEVPEPVATLAASTTPNDEILGLIETLPKSQQEVLVMLKVSGMTLEEVARSTGSSVGSVKQKAHRAYVKLRELLPKGGRDAG